MAQQVSVSLPEDYKHHLKVDTLSLLLFFLEMFNVLFLHRINALNVFSC